MPRNEVLFSHFLQQVEAGEVEVDPDYLSYLRWLSNGRPEVIVLPDDDSEEEGSVHSGCTVLGDNDEEISLKVTDELLEQAKKEAEEKEKMREERKRQRAKECLEKNLFRRFNDEAGPSRGQRRVRVPRLRRLS